jgi:hypothetical protein
MRESCVYGMLRGKEMNKTIVFCASRVPRYFLEVVERETSFIGSRKPGTFLFENVLLSP